MTTTESTATLGARWGALRDTAREAKQVLRTRDAADQLGVSEAALIDTQVGDVATRLVPDAASLLHAMVEVGRCMALTRCEAAVSEVRGRYGGVDIGAHAGLVVGENIDLRVFGSHWANIYAIDEAHPQRAGERRRSVHVFDRSGTAVHKIFLEPDGDAAAWDAIVAARAQPAALVVEPPPARKVERPDGEVEIDPFLAGWDAMQDTHEFFHLLAAHKLSRLQALRLAGSDRARKVRGDALSGLLHESVETGDKIMIFVGNRGCLQVFSGAVHRIVRTGPWINVLDPEFNLHLREDLVASSWVVNKPTAAGVVRSLELYDANGDTVALVFRKRDDRDNPEDPAWRALLDRMPEAR